MTKESWVVRCMLVCAACLSLLPGTGAAQVPLRAALFKTGTEQAGLTQLAAALDPVLAEQLGKAAQLSIVSKPALDLSGLQLAVDCVGETPSCLAIAAERSGADAVLSPSLSRTDAEIVVSLLFYDPGQRARSMRVVTRRVPRQAGDGAVLSAGAALVQELFGVPGPQPTAAEPAPAPPPAAAEPAPPLTPVRDSLLDPEPIPERSQSLVAPIALGLVGVIGLGAGVGFGLAANHAEDRYASQHITNAAGASRADDRYDSAARSAILSNVSFGVGAAALVAATIVWLVQRPRAETAAAGTRTRLAFEPGRAALIGGWR